MPFLVIFLTRTQVVNTNGPRKFLPFELFVVYTGYTKNI